MKLILTQEVDGLGSPGDIVEVKDGYGRNYLIPRNVAVRWTRGGQKQVDSIKAARSSRSVRDHAHAEQIKSKLEAGTVDVTVRAGANGRLFGTVTPGDLADALAAVAGEALDKRTIVVTNPIKALGAHTIAVKLHDDSTATVSLNVIPA
jgi:large subunit ribosomal protein L9